MIQLGLREKGCSDTRRGNIIFSIVPPCKPPSIPQSRGFVWVLVNTLGTWVQNEKNNLDSRKV